MSSAKMSSSFASDFPTIERPAPASEKICCLALHQKVQGRTERFCTGVGPVLIGRNIGSLGAAATERRSSAYTNERLSKERQSGPKPCQLLCKNIWQWKTHWQYISATTLVGYAWQTAEPPPRVPLTSYDPSRLKLDRQESIAFILKFGVVTPLPPRASSFETPFRTYSMLQR